MVQRQVVRTAKANMTVDFRQPVLMELEVAGEKLPAVGTVLVARTAYLVLSMKSRLRPVP
jgi:hypothetical protein